MLENVENCTFHILLEGMWNNEVCLQSIWQFFKMLNIKVSYNPIIVFLEKWKHMFTPKLVHDVHSVIHNSQKAEMKCSQEKQRWSILQWNIVQSITGNEVLTHATTWRNQKQKTVYYLIAFMWSVKNKKHHRGGK